MSGTLELRVAPGLGLGAPLAAQVAELCRVAYDEPFEEILRAFEDPTHVLGFLGDSLVSHALWVPRDLLYGGSPLRTAYVEAVATHPRHQGRGYASALLRRLASEITGFDLGVLSPSDTRFYERLGWERWRGPLLLSTAQGPLETPLEEVMILRLPRTPALDLDRALTAFWRPGEIW